MTNSPERARLSWTFSLRTLLLGVTVCGMLLGYEINWIHQRRLFLAEQLRRHEVAWAGHEENPERERTIQWWKNQLKIDARAPGILWMFGEAGVGRLWLSIPKSDVNTRSQEDSLGAYQQRVMSCRQSDYARAKQLFPEAKIIPIIWEDDVPQGSAMAMYEITLSDESPQ